MPTLSVVVPALNEAQNIEAVVGSVPVAALSHLGWDTEVLVVDNASTDGTGDLARAAGATVVLQPRRGYGSAYKAGFAAARGDVIVTGDADRTYPLDQADDLLKLFLGSGADFLTTNRLLASNRGAMKRSHAVGNHVLSAFARALFGHDLRDSQSGMWMFFRAVWEDIDVRSEGMGFSQEIKNEAFRSGFRTVEVPIEYRPRGGEVKLNALRDGVRNLTWLIEERRRPVAPARAGRSALGHAVPTPQFVNRRQLAEPFAEPLNDGSAMEGAS